MKDDSIAKREVRELKREVRKLKREREDFKGVLEQSVDALQSTLDALLRSHKDIMQQELKEPDEEMTENDALLRSHKHIMQQEWKEPDEERTENFFPSLINKSAAEVLVWCCGKPLAWSPPGVPRTIQLTEGARRTVLKSIYSDFDRPTRYETFEGFHGACEALIEYWTADWVHSWSLPMLKIATRTSRGGVAGHKTKIMKPVMATTSRVALDILLNFRLVLRHFEDYWEREDRSTTVRDTKRKL